MFVLDKLITAPLIWIAKEINEAVQRERGDDSETITRSLSELYMKLETGVISEQEFEAEEAVLLDRLDAIETARQAGIEAPDDESK